MPEPELSSTGQWAWGNTPGHAVQFYDDERFLHGAIADFVAAGLDATQPVIVIAKESTRSAFLDRVAARGFDVQSLERRGELTMLDATDTLSTFMVDGVPDEELFTQTVGRLIDDTLRGRGDVTVRAYGEMVDILWRNGNPEGAIRLEELWNELATTRRFSLLCGYAMGNFHKEAHWSHFNHVCSSHQHVLPTEQFSRLSDEHSRLREIAHLQQRAQTLETEIARRKELETALRNALADRERVQSERERLLARERTARAEAEAAGRLKDEFLAVLSHELRTPLNAILGWAHIAGDPTADERTIRRAIHVIQRNAKLQLHITDDLLDLSRILTGKMLVSAQSVQLADVLTAAAETVKPAAAAKDIEVELQLDYTLPCVTGDRDRLQQVLWNLLSNAIKFTPPRGRVQIRLERSGAYADVVVSDNGQGIAPDFLAHVFERFRQADSGTTRKHSGLGLGLAVVRHLVEAHGGTVRAESAGDGLGAAFIVTLPLRPVPAETAAEPPATREAAGLQDVEALVVDDEEDGRELFGHVLAMGGAKAIAVSSVDQALLALSTRRFDVVIGDIGLPDRDGYALIEAIRRHRDPHVRTVRAVAVTSYAGERYRLRALAAGYDEYMSKPVEPDRFIQLLSDLMRRSRRVENAM